MRVAQTSKNFYLYVLYIGSNVEHLSSSLLLTLFLNFLFIYLDLYSKRHLMVMDSLYYLLLLLN